jgi:hypothetical protein
MNDLTQTQKSLDLFFKNLSDNLFLSSNKKECLIFVEKYRQFQSSCLDCESKASDLINLKGQTIFNQSPNEQLETSLKIFSENFYSIMVAMLDLFKKSNLIPHTYFKKQKVSVENFIHKFHIETEDFRYSQTIIYWLYCFRTFQIHSDTSPKWTDWFSFNDSIIYFVKGDYIYHTYFEMIDTGTKLEIKKKFNYNFTLPFVKNSSSDKRINPFKFGIERVFVSPPVKVTISWVLIYFNYIIKEFSPKKLNIT